MALYNPHEKFQNRAAEELAEMGFMVEASPYHDTFNRAFVKRLAEIYSPTALHARSRADRLAVHKTLPLVFEWEAKTNVPDKPNGEKYANFAIEALPLAEHALLGKMLDVRCLYICEHHREDLGERGFWASMPPKFWRADMPNRWSDDWQRAIGGLINNALPGIGFSERVWYGGSGDPFVLIDPTAYSTLPDWRQLVEDQVKLIHSTFYAQPFRQERVG